MNEVEQKIVAILIGAIPGLRIGISTILEQTPNIEIAQQAASLKDIVELPAHVSMVILISIEPVTQDWLIEIQGVFPQIPLLLIVTDITARDILDQRLPAVAILHLQSSPEEILAAVQALNAGLYVVDRRLINRLTLPTSSDFIKKVDLDGFGGEIPVPFDPLTSRELDVFRQVALGKTNKEIAFFLKLSEHTVKFHITSIYSKLDVTNRAEAIRAGLKNGLIVL